MSPRTGPEAPVLVVTGATGTGKSTACGWLAQRGAFVIDADRVGHSTLLDPEVRRRLAEVFGNDILDERHRVLRPVLGAKALASDDATRQLNAVVHPPLVREIQRRVQALRQSRGVSLIVIDAALYFQFEPKIEADAVLMTVAPREVLVERIMARDGLTRERALDRLDRQRDVLASQHLADAVLDTSASTQTTRSELLKVVDRLLGTQLVESDFETLDKNSRSD